MFFVAVTCTKKWLSRHLVFRLKVGTRDSLLRDERDECGRLWRHTQTAKAQPLFGSATDAPLEKHPKFRSATQMKPNRISHSCGAGPLRPALPVFSDENVRTSQSNRPPRAMGELKRGSMRPQNGTGLRRLWKKALRGTRDRQFKLPWRCMRKRRVGWGRAGGVTARQRRGFGDVQKRSAKATERREQKFTFHIVLQ